MGKKFNDAFNKLMLEADSVLEQQIIQTTSEPINEEIELGSVFKIDGVAGGAYIKQLKKVFEPVKFEGDAGEAKKKELHDYLASLVNKTNTFALILVGIPGQPQVIALPSFMIDSAREVKPNSLSFQGPKGKFEIPFEDVFSIIVPVTPQIAFETVYPKVEKKPEQKEEKGVEEKSTEKPETTEKK